jgi:hypothetical protein
LAPLSTCCRGCCLGPLCAWCCPLHVQDEVVITVTIQGADGALSIIPTTHDNSSGAVLPTRRSYQSRSCKCAFR